MYQDDHVKYFLFQLITTESKCVIVHHCDKIDCVCFGVHMVSF